MIDGDQNATAQLRRLTKPPRGKKIAPSGLSAPAVSTAAPSDATSPAPNGDIQVIGLEVALEQALIQAVQNGGALEPGVADRLLVQVERALQGAPTVLLINPVLRAMLSRFLRRSLPQLTVLASTEIADNRQVRFNTMIGAAVE